MKNSILSKNPKTYYPEFLMSLRILYYQYNTAVYKCMSIHNRFNPLEPIHTYPDGLIYTTYSRGFTDVETVLGIFLFTPCTNALIQKAKGHFSF